MSQSNLAQTQNYFTVEEYLAFERESTEKHKYINGEIVSMAGASREHNLIGTNLTFAFVGQLRGKNCEVYANDMRVRMNPENYGYPDVVVVCGDPEFADDEFDVLLNPTVIVEVLSASTKLRDRTEKLEDFRKIESLKECLLVEQKKIFIQHYIKQTPNQWLLQIYERNDEIVKMESIGCEIAVSDIYLQVKFDAES